MIHYGTGKSGLARLRILLCPGKNNHSSRAKKATRIFQIERIPQFFSPVEVQVRSEIRDRAQAPNV